MLNNLEGTPKPGYLIDKAMEIGIDYKIIYLMGYNELLKALEPIEEVKPVVEPDRETWMRDD